MKKNQKKIIFEPAPVLLFVYKRIITLKKVIKSLNENELVYRNELYIFSDGPKNESEKIQIKKLRSYLIKIKGFKKVKIFARKKNIGLASNIIEGVSKIIKAKKKVIVIEDDLILSKNFLQYMNDNLEKYKNQKKVWHISGWNWNFNFPKHKYDFFFMRYATCWGWATWKNRWQYFEKNPNKLIKSFNKSKIEKFNLDNSYNFWSQVIRNEKKIINTWAIFWYATIFVNKGLSINPVISQVRNIGNDSYSTNLKGNITISKKIFKDYVPKKYPKIVQEDKILLEIIKSKLRPNFLNKIFNKIFNKILKQ